MVQWVVVAVAVAALAVAGFALLRANRIDRSLRLSLAALVPAGRAPSVLRPGADGLGAPSRSPAPGAGLTRVGVVRFDAFADVGGRMSFSLALLDDSRDGIVLTALHSRSETRTYLKRIQDGRGESALAPEEEEAVQQAVRQVRS